MADGYIFIYEAAERLNVTDRHVRRMCRCGQLPAVKKGREWLIPISSDERFAGPPDPTGVKAELSDVPANKRDAAIYRLGIIREAEKFAAAAVRTGGTRTQAIADFASAKNVAVRSLRRWMLLFRSDGIVGLIDSRGRSKFRCERITPEAFEMFKAMYLSEQRLSLKTCWQNIRYVNKDQKLNWKIPSLSYMHRLIKELVPMPVLVLHREGLAAYEAKCAPYVQRDPDSIQPGQVWVGDHSQFNCWIRHRGDWIRPWITAWQDMRSRAIVGYHISPNPNQSTILLAMKRGIEQYGPPDEVKIDNGKDYDSELFTGITKSKRKALRKGYLDEFFVAGIYGMMSISVSFAIPYHPQSKPVERFFDTLDCQFTKTLPTYCGKDTHRRPESLNELLQNESCIRSGYDIKQFNELVERYIETYNNTVHSGAGMAGQTPSQVLASRQSRRTLADGVLDLLMRVWSGELTVGKNGVRFRGIWYGQYDQRLLMHQGRKVRVSYDPDDMRDIHVYDAATMSLITIAEQNQLVRYGDRVSEEALRDAMKQKSRAVKIAKQYKDTRLAAASDLPTLTLCAMADAAKGGSDKEKSQAVNLRPVITPLNEQVHRVRQIGIVNEVKKAAGAETIAKVLNIDLEAMLPGRSKIKVFNE